MRPGTAVLTLAAVAVLLPAVNTHAQATNPPYVGRMPSAARLMAEVRGTDAVDASARRMAALTVLRLIIESLARSRPSGLTPDEKRLIGDYADARNRSSEYPDAPADQDKWVRLHLFYLRDPAFRDELLRRYFPAEVRAEYYRVTGKRPPDPPGAAAVKSPAAANPAAAKGVLYLADYSYRLGVASEKAGNKKDAAGQFAAAVENYKQAIEYDPTLRQAYLGLGNIYMNHQTNYELAVPVWKGLITLTPDDASIHGLLGMALYQLKRYDEALAALRNATRLKASPDVLAIAHYNIGLTHLKMGQKEKALEAYRKLQPIDQAEAQKLYAKINEATGPRPAAEASASAGGGGRASRPSGGAKAAPPTPSKASRPNAPAGMSADEYLAEGEKYFEAKDYARAVEAFKEAIALKPSDEAYGLLGLARQRLKQYPEAVTALQQAAKLNPTEASHHSNLGHVYLLMGQNEKAINPLRESLRLEPEPAVYVLLAITYHKLEQFPEEVMVLQQALKLAPNDARAHLQLGYAYVALRRRAEALQTYQNLQTIDPERAKSLREEIEAYLGTDDPKLFWRVADAALESKDYESMLTAYHHIIALKPADSAVVARARNGRGQAFVGLKKYERAAAEYREAIRRDPKQPGYYLNLGTTYLAMGKKAQAQQVYNTLLTLDRQKAQQLYAEISKMK